MSMNVFCYLREGSLNIEEVSLVSIPTLDSFGIVFVDGDALKGHRPWRESAKLYLAWVKRQYASKPNTVPAHLLRGTRAQRKATAAMGQDADGDAVVKRERRKIGKAWRAAEQMENGSLFFGVD